MEPMPKQITIGNKYGPLAIAEDGVILGSHWCSHEAFVPMDLVRG